MRHENKTCRSISCFWGVSEGEESMNSWGSRKNVQKPVTESSVLGSFEEIQAESIKHFQDIKKGLVSVLRV